MLFVEFWYMLILGKRSEAMWNKKHRFMRHLSKWQAYLMALTDKRPKFIED